MKEMLYMLGDSITKSTNTVITFFDGMKCYKSDDKNRNMYLTFYYDSDEESNNFRFECLYANTYCRGTDLSKDSKSS
jgi:hypothetical protein